MSALSVAAADALIERAAAAFRAEIDPAELALLLRGAARDHDGEAFALFGRLGFEAAAIAKALPAARALARAQSGARDVG